MNIEDFIFEGVITVIEWDIPDDNLPTAVMGQAQLLAGQSPDAAD